VQSDDERDKGMSEPSGTPRTMSLSSPDLSSTVCDVCVLIKHFKIKHFLSCKRFEVLWARNIRFVAFVQATSSTHVNLHALSCNFPPARPVLLLLCATQNARRAAQFRYAENNGIWEAGGVVSN
jgi:hypothetical protein